MASTRTRRCSRRGAAFPAATASLRQLLRRLPGQRRDQARSCGEPYAFDLDYCKGCGLCAAECPCGAIEMVPEEI